MFSRNRDDTTRAEQPVGIGPVVHSVLAVRLPRRAGLFFKGTSSQPIGRRRGINKSGVDFWHAVEFSRNGRFLCTHPLGLSSGRFPSVFLCSVTACFQPYQIRFPFRFRFGVHFRWPLEGLCLSAVPTLSEILSRNFLPLSGTCPSTLVRRVPLERSRKRTGAGRPDA